MAITEGTSPPPLTSAVQGCTTASFTPPAGSLVLVMAGGAGGEDITSITSSDGAVWTQLVYQSSTTNSSEGGTGIWCHYYATSPGAITVTSLWDDVNERNYLDVRVLDGCASVQNGATAGITADAVTTWFTNITTTTVGSWVYGIGTHTNTTTTGAVLTANSGWQTIGEGHNAAFSVDIYSGKKTAATTTPGAVSVGWTASTHDTLKPGGGAVFYEVIPGTAAPLDKPGADTGASTDAATVRVRATTDTATGTATAPHVAYTPKDDDTGTFGESAVAGETKSGVDTGTSTETAASVPATVATGADAGTFTEDVTTKESQLPQQRLVIVRAERRTIMVGKETV